MPYADDLARTLSPFSYEGVEFPGEDCSTTFGHDSAQHKGYGERGADIETTGPKAEVVRVKAVFSNGLRGWTGPDVLYPDTYQQVLRLLRERPFGILGHPTRGAMEVHFDEGTEEVLSKTRRGVTIALTFTENRGSSDLADMGFTVVGVRPEELLSAADLADATRPSGLLGLIARVLGAYASFRAWAVDILRQLAALQESYVSAVAVLDEYAADIKDLIDDPGAALAEANPFKQALNKTLATVTRLRRDLGGERVRQYVVPADASLGVIAADPDVFGDAARAPELMASNVILTPWLIRAGTVLTVVD